MAFLPSGAFVLGRLEVEGGGWGGGWVAQGLDGERRLIPSS